MAVAESEVAAVAALARLDIEAEALADVTERFGRILEMVDALNTVDTDGITPMSNPHDAVQRLREDKVTPGEDRASLMSNAPEQEDGYFLVPRVID